MDVDLPNFNIEEEEEQKEKEEEVDQEAEGHGVSRFLPGSVDRRRDDLMAAYQTPPYHSPFLTNRPHYSPLSRNPPTPGGPSTPAIALRKERRIKRPRRVYTPSDY